MEEPREGNRPVCFINDEDFPLYGREFTEIGHDDLIGRHQNIELVQIPTMLGRGRKTDR